MPTTFDAFLAHTRGLTGRFLDLRLSEADTRSYLIDPVLRILGYEGVEHLRREVPIASTKEFIDYELRVNGVAAVLVEAKAQRVEISDQHAAQCVQYASIVGVRWCFITNGVTWQLYDAHAKGPLEKKRVAAVRLDSDAAAAHAWTVLSLFAREELERSRPINSLLIERVIEDELADPESSIVKAMRGAVQARFGERVTAADVVATARKLMHAADATAVPQATTPTALAPPPATARTRKSQPAGDAAAREGTEPAKRRVTLKDLVDAGLLPDGASIEAIVAGVSHVARVVGGRIELEGKTYDSPSAASCGLRTVGSWNGWVDWKYKGVLLADLRRKLVGEPAADEPAAG